MPQMVKFKCDILSDFLSEGAIKWIEIFLRFDIRTTSNVHSRSSSCETVKRKYVTSQQTQPLNDVIDSLLNFVYKNTQHMSSSITKSSK